MDILKIFKLYDREFPINIKGTVEKPLFQANQIGKLLGIKNISDAVSNYDERMRVLEEIHTTGGKQKALFLTEIGLYRILFRSNKPIALEFQIWVCNVIKEIRLNGCYHLTNENYISKEMLKRQIEIATHKTLVSSFHCKKIVYVCALDNHKNIDNTDSCIYKIGMTNNIKQRCFDLENQYGPVTMLNIFECANNAEFEKYLLKHSEIKPYRYTEKITKANNRELFLFPPEILHNVLVIIKKNIKKYNDISLEMKLLDIENNKVRLEMLREIKSIKNSEQLSTNDYVNHLKCELKNEFDDFTQEQDNEDNVISLTENLKITENVEDINKKIAELNTKKEEVQKEIEENYSEPIPEQPEYEWKEGDTLFDAVPIANTKSPYIQKYDATTFELLETFDSIIDLTRQNPSITYYGLKTAAKNNSNYLGFRWLFVPKDKPNVKYDLEPTKHVPYTPPNQLIAMLNIDKTMIVEVYPSQKHAALSRKFNSFAPISQAIKNGTISASHYWKRYDECSDELKATYTNPLPEKIKKPNGSRKVNIIHKTTKEIVKTYDSVQEAMTAFQISRRKLSEVCATKEVYKNWIFEIVE